MALVHRSFSEDGMIHGCGFTLIVIVKTAATHTIYQTKYC